MCSLRRVSRIRLSLSFTSVRKLLEHFARVVLVEQQVGEEYCARQTTAGSGAKLAQPSIVEPSALAGSLLRAAVVASASERGTRNATASESPAGPP